ncbi:DUF6644 family protein [uncultured Paraglaciecola sp.]|uniref:DUF6644 family protein n=1 Tax=uncultured Paraglaciecola sp. TaxID=1765024 RepID=UPI002596E935|nr:DUF6644 family protein [uncultured Paraglaciecola sp.]
MNNLLTWIIDTLNATALSDWVMNNAVVFPALEIAHFLGLSLLFGSLLIVDLRVVGFAKTLPIRHVEKFIWWAIIGFGINLISGLLFVVGDSDRYLINIAFGAKMGVIILAGLNTLYFMKRTKPQLDAGLESNQLTKSAHAIAWLSLICWTAVIILGRFIPYVE